MCLVAVEQAGACLCEGFLSNIFAVTFKQVYIFYTIYSGFSEIILKLLITSL